MATIVPTEIDGSTSYRWTDYSTADTSSPARLQNMEGLAGAVQVTGTFGGATIALQVSNDGTNYSAALIPFDVATGLPAADATLSEGKYLIPKNWSFSHYKFTGSSTSDVKTIAFAALLTKK